MRRFKRIAVAKIGWGETYTGEEIKGRFGYFKKVRDAYERFNFKLGPGKRYYGYLPPIGPTFAVRNLIRRLAGWFSASLRILADL